MHTHSDSPILICIINHKIRVNFVEDHCGASREGNYSPSVGEGTDIKA